MGDAAELFGMCTARGNGFDSVGASKPGQSKQLLLGPIVRGVPTRISRQPALTGQDIAGAMGMGKLDPLAWLIVQVKYLDDAKKMRSLELTVLSTLASRIVVRNGVRREHMIPGVLQELTKMALQEVVGINRCHRCHGTGHVDHAACQPCAGIGRLSFVQSAVAVRLGISQPTWCRAWKSRWMRVCRDIICEIQRLDDAAQAHVSKRVG